MRGYVRVGCIVGGAEINIPAGVTAAVGLHDGDLDGVGVGEAVGSCMGSFVGEVDGGVVVGFHEGSSVG